MSPARRPGGGSPPPAPPGGVARLADRSRRSHRRRGAKHACRRVSPPAAQERPQHATRLRGGNPRISPGFVTPSPQFFGGADRGEGTAVSCPTSAFGPERNVLTSVTRVTKYRVSPKQEVGSPTFFVVQRHPLAHLPVDLLGHRIVPHGELEFRHRARHRDHRARLPTGPERNVLTSVTRVTKYRVSPKQEVGSPTFFVVQRHPLAHLPVDLLGHRIVPHGELEFRHRARHRDHRQLAFPCLADPALVRHLLQPAGALTGRVAPVRDDPR